jgi:P-type Mg2+ transporter
VLGVALWELDDQADSYSSADAKGLTFIGFLLFFDTPKADVQQTIVYLAYCGVKLKIITGDNEKVARHVAQDVHLPIVIILTGRPLNDKLAVAEAVSLDK